MSSGLSKSEKGVCAVSGAGVGSIKVKTYEVTKDGRRKVYNLLKDLKKIIDLNSSKE